MNNRKAKQIRYLVKKGFADTSTATAYLQNKHTGQIVLEPGCFRAIYQRVKKTMKKGAKS